MKKIACCLFFSIFFSQVIAANGNNGGANAMNPEVVAEISQTAIDKAASPDGIKGILQMVRKQHRKKLECSVLRQA